MTTDDMIKEMYSDMQDMKSDMQNMKSDMQDMKSDIKTLQQKTSDIQFTLENETNRNIKIIAEEHRDLGRKLDAALTVENEKEMLLIRVNVLENEVRRLKEVTQSA